MRRDPVTPEPTRHHPARPPRRLWVYSLGLFVLVGTFALAWNLLHTPGRANGPSTPGAPGREGRAVAVAYVDVEGGVRNLYPTRTGRVARVPVEEGVEVPEGTVLLQLDDAISRAQEKEAKLALRAAERKLAEARDALDLHDLTTRTQQAAIAAAEADLAAAEALAGKARRQADRGTSGGMATIEAAEAQVAKAKAALSGEQGKQAALKAAKPKKLSHLVALAQIDIEAKQELVKKAAEDVQAHQLRAPAKGKVLRRIANVGEALGGAPKLPAVIFCPSGPRIVRAEVEQEFAGRVARGQKARIEDDATGGGEWRGKVERVSDWYTQRRSILLEPLQFNDVRTLEVIISVEEGKSPLRIGQRVRVTLE